MPITGYDNDVVNTLRIWDAEPIVDFELDSFDKGDLQESSRAGESCPQYRRSPLPERQPLCR